MFISRHTLKWTKTCRSSGDFPHAHTAHFLLNRHSQADKPAPRRSRNAGAVCDDAEASRRGAEESGLEDALMREVAEVAGKDPGADPRRLSNRGDAAGRPSEAGVFARLDDMPDRKSVV
mgnify:CR=1 FL=1